MNLPTELKIACPNCDQHISFPISMIGQIIPCPNCELSMSLNVQGHSLVTPKEPPITQDGVICPHCKGQMEKTKRTESNFILQLLGVILFIIGLGFCFTLIGAIIGIPLMIVAGRMGFKKEKVWLCNCGYFYKI